MIKILNKDNFDINCCMWRSVLAYESEKVANLNLVSFLFVKDNVDKILTNLFGSVLQGT